MTEIDIDALTISEREARRREWEAARESYIYGMNDGYPSARDYADANYPLYPPKKPEPRTLTRNTTIYRVVNREWEYQSRRGWDRCSPYIKDFADAIVLVQFYLEETKDD